MSAVLDPTAQGAKTQLPTLSRSIEHTCLKADARRDEILSLCEEAIANQFFGVCVNPAYVPMCAERLHKTSVSVVTVVGFPLGASSLTGLAVETAWCVAEGAAEVDMVIPIGAALEGNLKRVEEQVHQVVRAAGRAPVKAILETAYFQPEKDDAALRDVCSAALAGGAAFLKTSTGFGPGGATLHHVALLAECAGERAQVKASGGIRTREQAEQMLAAGARRIGTSSGVEIVKG